jgi:hypothetical protein
MFPPEVELPASKPEPSQNIAEVHPARQRAPDFVKAASALVAGVIKIRVCKPREGTMSIENGERFLRLLKNNPELREQVKKSGPAAFETLSASAGASSTSWEVVVAAIREIEGRKSQ